MHRRGFCGGEASMTSVKKEGGADSGAAKEVRGSWSCRLEHTTVIVWRFLLPPRVERRRGRLTPIDSANVNYILKSCIITRNFSYNNFNVK